MSQPYVGEIRMFGGNFAPAGWMFCEGQLLPISENEVLFQLIGTTYGGDGQSTFALPDLRGRLPIHMGTGSSGTTYTLAQSAGVEEVTLTTQQLPIHAHAVVATANTGNASQPQNNLLANDASVTIYRAQPAAVALNAAAISSTGGSQPHSNFQPYLCIDFIISLFGVFPTPT
jgi:microcystin-dependent protein